MPVWATLYIMTILSVKVKQQTSFIIYAEVGIQTFDIWY